MIPQQAVLLAGGTGSRLYPLNSTGGFATTVLLSQTNLTPGGMTASSSGISAAIVSHVKQPQLQASLQGKHCIGYPSKLPRTFALL